MSYGPVPTNLVFLSDLPSTPTGTKVRFLGCITSYAVKSGRLHLEHAYPVGPSLVPVTANLDISLLGDSVSEVETAIGAWMNVIGYVESGALKIASSGPKDGGGKPSLKGIRVNVSAQMMWSAGALDVRVYEEALEARKRHGGY